MEMKNENGMIELTVSEDEGIAVLPLEQYEDMVVSKFIVKVMRRLWNMTDKDGDEFEEVFELVFGQRYEDEDDENCKEFGTGTRT